MVPTAFPDAELNAEGFSLQAPTDQDGPVVLFPPAAVLTSFGVAGDPTPLGGGEGVSFRVGDVVLKRVHDTAEAEWTQSLISRVRQDGFRLPDPVSAVDGRWVHEGWSVSRFLRGLRPAAPAWRDITDAGLRFADAAEHVRDDGRDVLSRRTHRWAVADRVAWEEAAVDLVPEAREVMAQVSDWLGAPSGDAHFVHGDLTGNVFVDPEGVPVILDVSPYLRPRRWAAAIVIADAVLWNGANVSLAASFASERERDLLGRALIFRLVAEQLAESPRHGALLEPYRRLLSALAQG